jgi:uncharacterized NAD(P)/FAD-binding protein YdhS
MRKAIVIVGGGFCGTVLAANLLRRPSADPTDIVLIERGTAMGRGVAYAARDFPYLLNVPAGRLSAASEDPRQFLRFAQQSLPEADTEDFLPRALYGDYLQDALLQAERSAPSHVRLTRVFGEVRRIVRHGGEKPLLAVIADREGIPADRIILALGNPQSALMPWAEEVRNRRTYVHDPWTIPMTMGAEHSVLIVGNGLTMVDVALALSGDPERTPQLATISRHGLIPEAQTTFRPSAVQGDGDALLACATCIRQVLSASRALAREVVQLGGDWREVVTFIRTLAPDIWRRLPELERRRFVRHLQCYWDIHRHRLPPALSSRIEYLRRSGKLQINAGRIERLVPFREQLRVLWRRRGTENTTELVVDAVINATGPDYAINRSLDPLIESLRNGGLISPDRLNLGLRTTTHGACVAADGRASEHLYYLGPLLRAEHWEATAAAELRNHAEHLARHLVVSGDLGRGIRDT